MITAASLLFLVPGLGFATVTPFILVYVMSHGSGPVAFGIEFLDGGSRIGLLWGYSAVIALGLALTAVGVMEVVAGLWLMKSLRRGGRLAIALLPLDLFFAVGFGIPVLYVLPPVRTIILASGWKGLR